MLSSTVQESTYWLKSAGSDRIVSTGSSAASASEKIETCRMTNPIIAANCTNQFVVRRWPHTGKRRATDITTGVSSAQAYVNVSSTGSSRASDTGAPTRRLYEYCSSAYRSAM